MPDVLEQPDTEQQPVASALIPKGRENDYWELSAPAADFLEMQIDRTNMYVAPLLITNGSEDRDGEITNPDGLIDAAYRVNPMVFLQHSHRIQPLVPPVGTAETPDRKYDLHRRDDGWYSGCRFTQATKFASQVFRLVDDGVLRGRSIGALNHALAPYKPRLPGVAFVNNQIMPVRTKSVSHEKYELIEWSWVWMPANREIVTPSRQITPDNQVVPIIKGVLSHNRLDGMPLDPALKMIMKSLNLAEPVSNLNHAGKVRYWPFATQESGEKPLKTPFAILFSAKNYTPADAVAFLRNSSDIGIIETPLSAEHVDGQQFLKSTQVHYSGPVERVTSKDVPGMVLLFAKGLEDDLAAEAASGDNSESVDVAAAQAAAGAAAAATAADKPEVIDQPAADAAETVKMQPGLRYLKALIKKATEVADEAEAAMEEQEPELMDKCKQFTTELRSYISKVAEYQAERYGTPDGAMESDQQKPVTAELEKSLRADLFFERKMVLPTSMAKALQVLHDNSTDKQKMLAAAMLKGVITPEMNSADDDERQKLRDAMRQRLMKRLTSGLA